MQGPSSSKTNLTFELSIFYYLAMAKEAWRRDDVRPGGRNGNGELAAGVEGVLSGETATALLPSVRATREVAP